jgi:hypothetical protein
MPEEPSAAAGLAATLAEFDPPTVPDGTPPPQEDDFLASFDILPKEDATPVEPEPPPAPDAGIPVPPPADPAEPAAADSEDDPYPENPPAKGSEEAKTLGWGNLKSDLKKTRAELRAERDRAAKEIQDRDARLAELEKQVAQLPELSEKAKYVEETEKELAIARVEGTRDFKETILKPLEAIQTAAEALAKSNDIKLDDMLDVFTELDPVKQREGLKELIAGLDSVDQLEIAQMAKDSRMLLLKREEILTRATEARKELEERNRQRETVAQKERREAFEKSVDHTISELKTRIPFVPLVDGETAEAMFAAIAEKAKESDFDAAPTSTKAVAAAATYLLPRVTRQLVESQAEIKKLRERIKAGNSSKPQVGGTTSPPASAGGNDDGDFMDSFTDILGLQRSRPITQLVDV